MPMTPLQGPENQHVECALEQFDTVLIVRSGSHMVVDSLLLSRHAVDCLPPLLGEVSVISPKLTGGRIVEAVGPREAA